MNKVLLSVHVLAAVIFIGPVTVAASMFPPIARRELAADQPQTAVLRTLHRISTVYAIGGIAVPVFGIAVGAGLGVLGEVWLVISMALTAVAAGVLVVAVLPVQAEVIAVADQDGGARTAVLPKARRLSMTTGMFGLLWATVTVLMIVRPGSTTGV